VFAHTCEAGLLRTTRVPARTHGAEALLAAKSSCLASSQWGESGAQDCSPNELTPAPGRHGTILLIDDGRQDPIARIARGVRTRRVRACVLMNLECTMHPRRMYTSYYLPGSTVCFL
jgi:hypothetical protein